jgi:hypothetical protein
MGHQINLGVANGKRKEKCDKNYPISLRRPNSIPEQSVLMHARKR